MAANPVSELKEEAGEPRNFDMEKMRNPSSSRVGDVKQWPAERLDDDDLGDDWLHGDFKAVALPYVDKMYQNVIDLDSLKERKSE